jgi:hypothetical protein
MSGIRREFTFGQFEYRFPRVIQIQRALDLAENPLSVIRHPGTGGQCISADADLHSS